MLKLSKLCVAVFTKLEIFIFYYSSNTSDLSGKYEHFMNIIMVICTS